MSPLVSVIVPTYNRAHTVGETIESILGQTYSAIEVIVVDDGSTDNTAEVLAVFGDRIRVYRQQNAGPSAARNRGIEAATGDLIAFLDSDDIWLPSKVERQVALLAAVGEEVPCCLCNIRMEWKLESRTSFDIAELQLPFGEGILLNVAEILATRFLLFSQGVMIRKSALRKTGNFRPDLRYLEDYDLSLKLSIEGAWAVIREPLVVWRETSSGSLYQTSKANEGLWKEPKARILADHLERVEHAGADHQVRHYVRKELDAALRELRILDRNKSGASPVGTKVLGWIERIRRSLFLRSGDFPSARMIPVNETSLVESVMNEKVLQ